MSWFFFPHLTLFCKEAAADDHPQPGKTVLVQTLSGFRQRGDMKREMLTYTHTGTDDEIGECPQVCRHVDIKTQQTQLFCWRTR